MTRADHEKLAMTQSPIYLNVHGANGVENMGVMSFVKVCQVVASLMPSNQATLNLSSKDVNKWTALIVVFKTSEVGVNLSLFMKFGSQKLFNIAIPKLASGPEWTDVNYAACPGGRTVT